MKTLLLVLALMLSGCSLIPSKWDVNQARVLTDIRQEAGNFDCKANIPAQLNTIEHQVEWFHLYADYRKTTDLDKMMTTLDTTVKEFQKRVGQGPVSPTYCQLKQMIIVDQADIIGHTISGSL